MKGTLSLKTAPAIDPITLTEIKAHCRIDISDDDTYLGTLIKAGVSYIEALTGIRLVSQTWYFYMDDFPTGSELILPIGPVTAISSVKYTSESTGAVATLSTDYYSNDLVSLPARIFLKPDYSWPDVSEDVVNGVVVEFVAGYAVSESVATTPADLKAAVKLLVSHWYEHRMAAGEAELKNTPMAVESILANYRMWQR